MEAILISCPRTFQNALGRSGTPLHMSPCDVRPEVVPTSPDVSLGASGRTETNGDDQRRLLATRAVAAVAETPAQLARHRTQDDHAAYR